MIREYYLLAKPGIVRGNALSLLAGYFLAAGLYGFDLKALLAVLFGSSLVIASGCVSNNYLDRAMDAKMPRTRKRALVTGSIRPGAALAYAAVLGAAGFTILWLFTNPLTVLLGAAGFVWYVFVYGLAKRMTPWSTLIGTVCGAIPPVAGYAAISGRIDGAAIILFAILTVWQMPHFYAIAIRRAAEYRAGGVPVLAVVRGVRVTKRRIIAYMILYCLTVPFLTIFGYTGLTYLVLSVASGAYWLIVALHTWGEPDDKKWAARIFGVSLLVLLVQSVLIATGSLLP